MNDFTLKCNIIKCQIPLNETAWVTRCLHVFCPPHGQAYFSNTSPQISCPICNEINLKEVDILLCEINPSDLILVGLPPEKAITMAVKSLKLWLSQIQEEQNMQSMKVHHVTKKNNNMKYFCEKFLKKMKIKYEAEINGLKAQRQELLEKIKEKTNELQFTKDAFHKYKIACTSSVQSKGTGHMYIGLDSFSSHWNKEHEKMTNSPDFLRINSGAHRETDSPPNWDVDSIFR